MESTIAVTELTASFMQLKQISSANNNINFKKSSNVGFANCAIDVARAGRRPCNTSRHRYLK